MDQHTGLMTPEERAGIKELQDLLIGRFVEHREATGQATGTGPEPPQSYSFRIQRRHGGEAQ
jgi:hypothetical protein